MNIRLKKLNEQVMVITGATSGIGLVTARMAAGRGARLILAARNEEALRRLVNETAASGAQAVYVVANVGKQADVRRIAEKAIEHFGDFDTWVNNAGVSIYGRVLDVSMEDHRQLFETNYWGLVYGSQVAAEHLRQKGGALINIGSSLSDRAIPIQGTYCASKHAVKGYTDALRMELEEEGAPISVTLIKPSAIDTPYREHAKNYMPGQGHADIVRRLLNHGANVNAEDDWQLTSLMRAAESGHLEVVRLLLEHGANTVLRDDRGKTALGLAEENRHFEVAEFIRRSAKANGA
jgi:NAD(P)-dependent dehydrogenase (short-subunit alcohol dehydrogenase family)